MDGMGQAGGDVALTCPLPLPIRIMLNCSGFVASFCITETRGKAGWLGRNRARAAVGFSGCSVVSMCAWDGYPPPVFIICFFGRW